MFIHISDEWENAVRQYRAVRNNNLHREVLLGNELDVWPEINNMESVLAKLPVEQIPVYLFYFSEQMRRIVGGGWDVIHYFMEKFGVGYPVEANPDPMSLKTAEGEIITARHEDGRIQPKGGAMVFISKEFEKAVNEFRKAKNHNFQVRSGDEVDLWPYVNDMGDVFSKLPLADITSYLLFFSEQMDGFGPGMYWDVIHYFMERFGVGYSVEANPDPMSLKTAEGEIITARHEDGRPIIGEDGYPRRFLRKKEGGDFPLDERRAEV